MKHPQLITTMLVAGAFAPLVSRAQPILTPPQVQNIQVAQRPGTMFVDITYDLVDPDSTNIYVIAEFSADDGMTYGLPIFSLGGDIGPVRPGTGRHIGISILALGRSRRRHTNECPRRFSHRSRPIFLRVRVG